MERLEETLALIAQTISKLSFAKQEYESLPMLHGEFGNAKQVERNLWSLPD
jgi:hypothetical protein